MDSEAQYMMEQLISIIKSSQEYNQYKVLLAKIKEDPDIYRRIGEFRRQSIYFNMTDHVNPIEENNNLQKGFADLRTNGLAAEFMAAEHQYCLMVRHLQDYFLENLELELDFLNE